jgi:hypothetical protein
MQIHENSSKQECSNQRNLILLIHTLVLNKGAHRFLINRKLEPTRITSRRVEDIRSLIDAA